MVTQKSSIKSCLKNCFTLETSRFLTSSGVFPGILHHKRETRKKPWGIFLSILTKAAWILFFFFFLWFINCEWTLTLRLRECDRKQGCPTYSGAASPSLLSLGLKLPPSMSCMQEQAHSLSLVLRSGFGFTLSSGFFLWHLVLLHRNQAVSHKFAFLMKLYSNKIPFFMQKDDLLQLGLQSRPSGVCVYFCFVPRFSHGWGSTVSLCLTPISAREM